jgi:hypothetical protein
MSCYRRRYSVHFFGGNRDSALEHDGRACRACQSQHYYLNVHHRHPGDHTQLVTLCAGCHARVHRTGILRRWLPEILVLLWREWHPDSVEQLQLPLELSAAALSGAGWQIFSGFPARIAGGPLPEDESDGGDKDSRVFLPGPAQYCFDWATGGQEGARV